MITLVNMNDNVHTANCNNNNVCNNTVWITFKAILRTIKSWYTIRSHQIFDFTFADKRTLLSVSLVSMDTNIIIVLLTFIVIVLGVDGPLDWFLWKIINNHEDGVVAQSYGAEDWATLWGEQIPLFLFLFYLLSEPWLFGVCIWFCNTWQSVKDRKDLAFFIAVLFL